MARKEIIIHSPKLIGQIIKLIGLIGQIAQQQWTRRDENRDKRYGEFCPQVQWDSALTWKRDTVVKQGLLFLTVTWYWQLPSGNGQCRDSWWQ